MGKGILTSGDIYDPAIKKFNLAGIASNLPVDALNPLLSFFASGINRECFRKSQPVREHLVNCI